MPSRALPAPLWFALALAPMIASQIIRLQQADAATWIFWDYAGRLGGLAVLAIVPAARAVAFRRAPCRIAWWEAALWIAAIVAADHWAGGVIRRSINAALPATVLGHYPDAAGLLHLVDVGFGLALVAASEEIVFRRCARHVLTPYVGDGAIMVIATSLLFGVYHWWTGVGNIVEAALIGVLLMALYRRAAALWPALLAHYLTDIVDFI
jgi:CAAX protease family protein